MSSRNTYFDLPSFVQKHMAPCIAKHHFIEGMAHGGVLTLSNSHCIIFLENLGEGVGFSFAAIGEPELKYRLSDYLNAFVDGGNNRFAPKAPQELDQEQQFEHDIKCYNIVLESDALDAPLAGNFDWIPRLNSFKEEYERLVNELRNLRESQHPLGSMLWRKRMNGDLTWMDEVRRILAEEESRP